MTNAISKALACLVITGATSVAMAGDTGKPYGEAAEQMKHSTEVNALARLGADKLEGMDIYASSGELLGDVDALVRNAGNQHMIVIGLEDDLKEVAVPLEKFSLSADGDRITTRLTRAELLAMPDYDPMDMESVDD